MATRKISTLYSIVKLLCRTLFHIFFRDYDAFHTGLIPQDEPLLVVSNHGNYLLDGLALLATYPGQISFLMAQPNFKTAIGGIARKIGTIPVLRPQDATKFDGAGPVTIAPDGSSITGDGIGTYLHKGDTVYIECGPDFVGTDKSDAHVSQCYAVVEEIYSNNQVAFKVPGLKWVPAAQTSERDISYVKAHRIVNHGSLNIRVARGNTLIEVSNALKAQEQQLNRGFLASSNATTTPRRVLQRILSRSPETDHNAAGAGGYHELLTAQTFENGTYTGADIPGSVPAPHNFHTTESTPLLKRMRSANPSQYSSYSNIKRVDSNSRLSSFSTTTSSHVVVDVADEDAPSSTGTMASGVNASGTTTSVSPVSTRDTTVIPPQVLSNLHSSGNGVTGAEVPRFSVLPCSFQYSRPIDHSVIYDSVWKNFEDSRTVAVFPEGVSSDDYHLLDFKYGCTIMVLGYLAQNPSKSLRIIPCGLNFYNRHRFRSHFYADYGRPLTVPDRLVEMYREGGEAKKKACTELLQMIHEEVEGRTLNAPNYDELRLFKATRRLYSTGKKLSVPQKLELTRRFAKGYSKLTLSSSMAELKRDINAFDKHLTEKGVRDWQLTANPSLVAALLFTLPALFLLPALFFLSLPGTLLYGPVGLLATFFAKRKGREAMLAFQSYLPVSRWPGRDVIATWKIVVCLALMPVCFILHGTILTILVQRLDLEILKDFWTVGRVAAFWLASTLLLFPFVAYCTVWIWEWQIDLKMQIQIWWWKLCGGNAELKRWRQALVGRMNELVEGMGGHSAFDVSDCHR